MRAKPFLARLWSDDRGSIMSVEYLMVFGAAVTAASAGLTSVRNSVVGEMRELGNTVNTARQSVTSANPRASELLEVSRSPAGIGAPAGSEGGTARFCMPDGTCYGVP